MNTFHQINEKSIAKQLTQNNLIQAYLNYLNQILNHIFRHPLDEKINLRETFAAQPIFVQS